MHGSECPPGISCRREDRNGSPALPSLFGTASSEAGRCRPREREAKDVLRPVTVVTLVEDTSEMAQSFLMEVFCPDDLLSRGVAD